MGREGKSFHQSFVTYEKGGKTDFPPGLPAAGRKRRPGHFDRRGKEGKHRGTENDATPKRYGHLRSNVLYRRGKKKEEKKASTSPKSSTRKNLVVRSGTGKGERKKEERKGGNKTKLLVARRGMAKGEKKGRIMLPSTPVKRGKIARCSLVALLCGKGGRKQGGGEKKIYVNMGARKRATYTFIVLAWHHSKKEKKGQKGLFPNIEYPR